MDTGNIQIMVGANFFVRNMTPPHCRKEHPTYCHVIQEVELDVLPENLLHATLKTSDGTTYYTFEGLEGIYLQVAPVDALTSDFTLLGREVFTPQDANNPSSHEFLVKNLWGLEVQRFGYNSSAYKHVDKNIQKQYITQHGVLYVVPTVELPDSSEQCVQEYLVQRASKLKVCGQHIFLQVQTPHILCEVYDSNHGFTYLETWEKYHDHKTLTTIRPSMEVNMSVVKDFSELPHVSKYRSNKPVPAYSVVPITEMPRIIGDLVEDMLRTEQETSGVSVSRHDTPLPERNPHHIDTHRVIEESEQYLTKQYQKLGLVVLHEPELRRVSRPYHSFPTRDLRLLRSRANNIITTLQPKSRYHATHTHPYQQEYLDELCAINSHIHRTYTQEGFETIEYNLLYIH